MGLSEEDFKKKRTKEDVDFFFLFIANSLNCFCILQIKGIFNAIGLTYKIGKFEAIFQRAKDIVKK